MRQLKEQLGSQDEARRSAGGAERQDSSAHAMALIGALVEGVNTNVAEGINYHKALFEVRDATGKNRRAIQALQLKMQVRKPPLQALDCVRRRDQLAQKCLYPPLLSAASVRVAAARGGARERAAERSRERFERVQDTRQPEAEQRLLAQELAHLTACIRENDAEEAQLQRCITANEAERKRGQEQIRAAMRAQPDPQYVQMLNQCQIQALQLQEMEFHMVRACSWPSSDAGGSPGVLLNALPRTGYCYDERSRTSMSSGYR